MAEAKVKRPRGRQTIRTPELDDRILAWIADGQTLASFCRQPGTPASVTVEKWKEKDDEFGRAYAHAREIGGQVIADRLREIAAEPIPQGLEKGEANAIVMHRRLMIDTDKWLLARWFPTQYGERVAVTGADGAPLQISNADAVREVTLLLATAAARKLIEERKEESMAIEVDLRNDVTSLDQERE